MELAPWCFIMFTFHMIYGWAPPLEVEHNPLHYRPTYAVPWELNGTDYTVPPASVTPDFRLDEPPFNAYKDLFYGEYYRPYRMSPHMKMVHDWRYNWRGKKIYPYNFGCYCCTVFKRLTLLAGCAVITTRHILTTATSTDMIVRHRKHFYTLENILGAWYDNAEDTWNSSMYATPARIHYHTKYLKAEMVNRSHPIPAVLDLAVWALTYRVYFNWHASAVICVRATNTKKDIASPTPRWEVHQVIGFQLMWNWRRKPMPWMKYAIRISGWDFVHPCPKTEWGWFFCVAAEWAKLGIDSGAALHRCNEGFNKRYDGLVAISSFSMRLRSKQMTHYFTVLDRYVVLDWLYNAYMGRLPYEYLDKRFQNTKGKAPIPYYYNYVPWSYPHGVAWHYKVNWW